MDTQFKSSARILLLVKGGMRALAIAVFLVLCGNLGG
jgi:hypothetical protein